MKEEERREIHTHSLSSFYSNELDGRVEMGPCLSFVVVLSDWLVPVRESDDVIEEEEGRKKEKQEEGAERSRLEVVARE